MKRLWRGITRGLLTMASLSVGLTIGVAVVSQTQGVREYLRRQTVAYLNQSYRGHFSISRVDGSVLWGIRLHDLQVWDRDAQVLRVSTVSVGYWISDLLRKQELSRVEIDHAVGHLERTPDQQWNLLDALSSRQPQPETQPPSKSQLTIRDLVLRDSVLEVVQDGKTYRIEPSFIGAYFNLDGSSIDARINRVALRVAAPGIPNVAADGSLAYRSKGEGDKLKIPALMLSTAASQIQIFGTIDNLDTLQGNTTILIDHLGSNDIQRYIPQWAPDENLSGMLRVRGSKTDLHTSVDLLVADGKINGQGVANLTAKTTNFGGSLSIAGLNLGKAIRGAGLQGVIDANVKAQGVGTSLGSVNAKAAVKVHDATMGAFGTQLVAMHAGLNNNVVTVTGELTGGTGNAQWQGQANLGSARSYDLTLSLDHLNVRRISASQQPIDSNLNLRAHLVGSGFGLANLRARADVALLPSTVARVRITGGRIDARIADRRAHTDVAMRATAAQLRANGDIALTADHQVGFGYDLQLADLAPWLALIGQQGGGSLNLTGRTVGSLDDLRTQDEVRFAALTYGTNYVGCGSASVDMNAVGEPKMHGRVALAMNQVQSRVKLKSVRLNVSFKQLHPVTIAGISLQTEDASSIKDSIEAEIRKGPVTSELTVGRVSIQDPEETWTNPSPARIVADPTGLTIDRFVLESGRSRILVKGHAGNTGTQDTLMQIEGLRLSGMKAALGHSVDLSGRLSLMAHVGGSAAAPAIQFASSVTDLKVAGQSYHALSATASYDNERAKLELTFRQDATHSLTAKGVLPVALSWNPGLQMKLRGDVDLHATSSGLSLAVLNALAPDMLREVNGLLLMDLTVTGKATQPNATGFVRIQKAAATIVPTGVKVDNLELATNLSPQLWRISEMRMSSGDGTIDANGQITMENHRPGKITMMLRMAKWPVVKNQQYRATADGQINIGGKAAAPAVTGRIEVLDALLRPDIAFLASGPPPPDPTIHFVSTTLPAHSTGLIQSNPSCPPPPHATQPSTKPKSVETNINSQRRPSVNITVHLRRDIWVKQESGSAELTGDIQVLKPSAEPLRLIGTIESVRGWLNIMGKQFKVASAKITFAGGAPIDPGLAITADYHASQYLVHVILGGTASKPTLAFKSEPELEQADILSVLLFGKTTSQLSGSERADLTTSASEVATGFAASQISQQVSQALGLEEMGIELRQTGTGVGVSSYMGQNTYATFSENISQQGGQRVDVEHYLTRHLEVDTDTTSRGDRGADVLWSTNY